MVKVTAEDGERQGLHHERDPGRPCLFLAPAQRAGERGRRVADPDLGAAGLLGQFSAGRPMTWTGMQARPPPTDERDWNRATRSVVPLAPSATSYKFTGTYEIQRTGGRHTVTNGTTYPVAAPGVRHEPRRQRRPFAQFLGSRRRDSTADRAGAVVERGPERG